MDVVPFHTANSGGKGHGNRDPRYNDKSRCLPSPRKEIPRSPGDCGKNCTTSGWMLVICR